MTDHLPPLPDEGIFDGEIRVWTTSQMTAYALQAIKQLRQPLTDEQIKEAWRSVKDTGRDMHNAISFARAIEAAHGIKETP